MVSSLGGSQKSMGGGGGGDNCSRVNLIIKWTISSVVQVWKYTFTYYHSVCTAQVQLTPFTKYNLNILNLV